MANHKHFTKSAPTSQQATARPIPLKVGGRIVGVLRPGGVLDIRRTSAGILYNPPAIALACDLLSEAQARGCQYVQVSVTDQGEVYTIPFETFLAKSWPISRGGFEPQRACALSDFTRGLEIESTALLPGEVVFRPAPKPRVQQLWLFAVGGGR